MNRDDKGGTVRLVLKFQRNELTEHHIYARLARSVRDAHNSGVLARIAGDELRHYEIMKEYTGRDVKPRPWRLFRFFWIARIFGLTFGIKLMERGEEGAQKSYRDLVDAVPGMQRILEDEHRHENDLIGLIREERLAYAGSVVLGLNDALVELTGTLAGLSFALQNTRLIAMAGLITGIAASLSMAASQYLSARTGEGGVNPLKSSLYTGIAYIVTVCVLVTPYLVLDNYLLCIGLTLCGAVLIILLFNYYLSVAKDLPFVKRFLEMAAISLGVALISFGIGYLVRTAMGIDVQRARIQDVFPFDAKLEDDTVEVYNDFIRVCVENGDRISMKLFETITEEEQEYFNYFDNVNEHITRLGASYLATIAGTPAETGPPSKGFVTKGDVG